MTGYNLPPGCEVSDIPGNRPEDIAWESFHERIDHDTEWVGLTPDDAATVWRMGLSAYARAREHFSGRFTDMRRVSTEDE